MPSTGSQITLIKHVRERYAEPIIIANLSYNRFSEEMYAAGADYIMMPHLMAGEWLGNLLKSGKLTRSAIKKLVIAQKESLKLGTGKRLGG